MTTAYFAGLAVCNVSAIAIASGEQQTVGQQWTVLALLATVVLGIGGRIALLQQRILDANAEQAKTTALLLQQLQNDRMDSRTTRAAQFEAVHEKLDRMPEDVANELAHRRPT